MSQQNGSSLTPKQRIDLVQNDKLRRGFQIGIAVFIIAFGVGFLTWFVLNKADDNFLNYMAVGVLALVFGGMGAAYAIFGLGRTVGSNNGANPEQIQAMISVMLAAQSPPTGPATDGFFEDNQDDNLEEEMPTEVPIGRSGTDAIGAINADPSQLQYLADRNTWRNELKTINGKPVVLVATQPSRRTKSKRTVYVYHIVGTNVIIYNRSRHGIFFMRIAHRAENMSNFFDTFVNPPLTPEEKEWLERNDYVLT